MKWAHLSERNAKHLYIEKSQSIPGYGCQFFGVTLKVGGAGKGCDWTNLGMILVQVSAVYVQFLIVPFSSAAVFSGQLWRRFLQEDPVWEETAGYQ